MVYATYTVTGVGSTVTGSDLKANAHDVKLNLVISNISATTTWEWFTIATIPANLAPSITLIRSIPFYNSATGGFKVGLIRLSLQGDVQAYAAESLSGLSANIGFEYDRK